MRYTIKDIRKPDRKLGITTWGFSDDLRDVFDRDSNCSVGELLTARRVAIGDELDCESACTWASFDTEHEAKQFIRRLNAQPEVKNYRKPTKEVCYVLSRKDWKKMSGFLHETLTKRELAKLKGFGIRILEVQEHWVAAK